MRWSLVSLLLVTSCSKAAADPAKADERLPVAYVFCGCPGISQPKCEVWARFATESACADHKRFQGMLCDSTNPSRIVCVPPPADRVCNTRCQKD